MINLPYNFTHRHYQIEPWNAIMSPEFKRGIMVVPRRCGKDLLCWNAMIAKAMEVKGLYYYVAPYYNQVRQIIWEGFDGSGRRFLEYIPAALAVNKTKIDMRIDLVNGSQIKLQGSDNIDRIVGTNPRGIVFTEFSLHKPQAWEYLRPILAENGGWAIFNGTPRGLNHFYDLYNDAQRDPLWYVQYLTRDDTGVPTLEAIEQDRDSGMPEPLIRQEYYCSFTSGVLGAYYADLIAQLREDEHIRAVPWEPRLRVYTAWDLGVGDATAIWFFQVYGKEFRFIDYYEAQGEGLPHYAKVLDRKPYAYEEHFAPHDINVRELGTGSSRLEIAAELGINFTVVPKLSVEDGIEAARTVLPQCYFDSVKTELGVKGLTHYRKQFNERTRSFSAKPLHDWSSNPADAFRMFAVMSDQIGHVMSFDNPFPEYSTYEKPQVVACGMRPRGSRWATAAGF